MSTTEDLLPIAQTVSNAKGWDEFTRALMLAGKNLDALEPEMRTLDTAIEGCESPVWMGFSPELGEIKAYSPSKIIRGVLAVLLEKANSLNGPQRNNFDFDGYLERCQLGRYLSQSRGNGIKAVVSQLRSLC